MTRGFERTLTEYIKNILDIFSFKKIDEKNVKEFSNIEKDDLFYNVII